MAPPNLACLRYEWSRPSRPPRRAGPVARRAPARLQKPEIPRRYYCNGQHEGLGQRTGSAGRRKRLLVVRGDLKTNALTAMHMEIGDGYKFFDGNTPARDSHNAVPTAVCVSDRSQAAICDRLNARL